MSAIIALTYLKKYKKDINPVNIKQQDLNEFLIYCIVYYTDSKYNNAMLWYYIKKDFVKQIKKNIGSYKEKYYMGLP